MFVFASARLHELNQRSSEAGCPGRPAAIPENCRPREVVSEVALTATNRPVFVRFVHRLSDSSEEDGSGRRRQRLSRRSENYTAEGDI